MAVVAAVVLVMWLAVSLVRRHRLGLVAERGTSIGADLGTLADAPRVRVQEVMPAGSDTVRVILTPAAEGDAIEVAPSSRDFVVFLRDNEFGFELLQQWRERCAVLAIVTPPDTRLVRLRSVEDQQPLTLRRVGHE